jgi:uncharacterized protein YqjF (DUF2071 family)
MVIPLAMEWRELLFASWSVEPGVVAAHLSDALSVDTHDGDAWLSVVPFTNAIVRPRGVPAALGVDLPELNLRTYVTVDGTPSVYFFSLDAEGVLGVLGARLLHHLPYYYARIDHRADSGDHRADGLESGQPRRRQAQPVCCSAGGDDSHAAEQQEHGDGGDELRVPPERRVGGPDDSRGDGEAGDDRPAGVERRAIVPDGHQRVGGEV